MHIWYILPDSARYHGYNLTGQVYLWVIYKCDKSSTHHSGITIAEVADHFRIFHITQSEKRCHRPDSRFKMFPVV